LNTIEAYCHSLQAAMIPYHIQNLKPIACWTTPSTNVTNFAYLHYFIISKCPPLS
jgi:hypothetical protein